MKFKLNKKLIYAKTVFFTSGIVFSTLALSIKNQQEGSKHMEEVLDVIHFEQELNDCVVYNLHYQNVETGEWEKLPNLFVGSMYEEYNTVLVDGIFKGMKKVPVGYIDNRFCPNEIIGEDIKRCYTADEIEAYVFQKQEKNENDEWILTDNYFVLRDFSISLENTDNSRWIYAGINVDETFSVPQLKQAYAINYDDAGNVSYQETMRFTTIDNIETDQYVWIDSESYMLSEDLHEKIINSKVLFKK